MSDDDRARGSRPLTAASDARETARAATARGPRWSLFAGLAISIVVLDQLSKAWIVASLDLGHPIEILGDWLRLVLVHNTGGLFGLFGGQAPIFAAFSVVVIGLIVWYEHEVGRSLLATLALGLLVGGAIGNLVDRLRFGYVKDFVDMGIGSWRFYTYNVADSAISVSLLLLIVLALWGDRLGMPASMRPVGSRRGAASADLPGDAVSPPVDEPGMGTRAPGPDRPRDGGAPGPDRRRDGGAPGHSGHPEPPASRDAAARD